jgi:hypothetical protein
MVFQVKKSRLDHLERLYDILGTLDVEVGESRLLADCTGKLIWPERGVYFGGNTAAIAARGRE